MTAIDTSWLKEVCADPVMRPSLSEPMAFEHDGKTFTVATDGHRLVELPGNDGGFKPVPGSMMPSLLGVVEPTPDSAVLFDYAALKAFITEEMKDVVRDCLECQGTGIGPVPFDRACPKCPGACRQAKRVYIGGVLFDARLWEPMLANLPESRFYGWYQKDPRKMAIVDGLDWRFFVMPMDDGRIHSTVQSTYHRFEIPGAQALAA